MIVLDDRTSWNISMEILRPLCAPHAPPPIWIGTPEVTSTRGVIPRFSIWHVYAVALDGWMDIFQGNENLRRLREIFFSFRFFFFSSLREDRYWMKRVDACSVEGRCRIWLVSKRNFIIVLQGLRVLDDWAFEIVWNFYSWNVCVVWEDVGRDWRDVRVYKNQKSKFQVDLYK